MPSLRGDDDSTDLPTDDHSEEVYEMDTLSQGQSSADVTDRTPLRTGKPILNNKEYAVGIALLFCVVVLWTASSFVTQDLFEGGFAKPFFVTYMNTSAFTLYLIPRLVKKALHRYRTIPGELIRPSPEYQPLATDDNPAEEIVLKSHSNDSGLPKLTQKETAHLAAVFCILWFIANWTLNASLDLTTVASATILSSMSGFFTLAIGRLFRVEQLSLLKIGTVFIGFFGVILVSWSDSNKEANGSTARPTRISTFSANNPLLGDALALLSALFYALYVILLKLRIKSESRIDMQLFFGFVGLFNIILCWPAGVILHIAGIEVFELPNSRTLWLGVLVNMFITWSSDYLYVLAMLKTTPLVVTVGLSLTIPFAVIGDFFRGTTSNIQVVFGAVLILISFIVLGIAGNREEEKLSVVSERFD